jgi:hypothetical protein
VEKQARRTKEALPDDFISVARRVDVDKGRFEKKLEKIAKVRRHKD